MKNVFFYKMVLKFVGFKKLWKFFVFYMGILFSIYIRNDLSIILNEYDFKILL